MPNYDSFEAEMLMEGMTSEQKLRFHREMSDAWRDPKKAARLKRWVGGLGAHHFYLGDQTRGVKYLLFCWTSVPVLMSFFEGNIKKRTESLNCDIARQIAMRIKGQPVLPLGAPGVAQPSFCTKCGHPFPPLARVCTTCGVAPKTAFSDTGSSSAIGPLVPSVPAQAGIKDEVGSVRNDADQKIVHLERLPNLREKGVLTDEEFQTEKAIVFGDQGSVLSTGLSSPLLSAPTPTPAHPTDAAPAPSAVVRLSTGKSDVPPDRSSDYALPVQSSPNQKSSAISWRWILGGVGILGLLSLSAVLFRPSGNPVNDNAAERGGVSQKPNVTPTSGDGPISATVPGTNNSEATAPAALSDQERNKFLREGWGFVAENEESIVKQFGPPRNVSRRKVQNRQQPSQMDEVVELHYNGLSVTLYINQLSELMITDAKFPVAHDLGVGASSDRIVQFLGKPNEEKDGEISYSDNMSGQSSVHFKCIDGHVVRVTWSFEFD